MSLKITKQTDVYEIKGVLNTQNKRSIKNYFEMLIKQSVYIKLSLNQILSLDANGVQFIASIYKDAVVKGIIFFIVGVTNRDLVTLFRKENITTY